MPVHPRRASRLALIAVLVLGAAACSSDIGEQPREDVSTRELTGDLSGDFNVEDARVGARQSLRVTVADVLTPSAFTTTAADADGEQLLVVGPDRGLVPGQVVQVAGILRVFAFEDLAEQYQLGDRAVFAGRDGDLVLVATTVDTDLPADDQ